jgi:hypothetical protein
VISAAIGRKSPARDRDEALPGGRGELWVAEAGDSMNSGDRKTGDGLHASLFGRTPRLAAFKTGKTFAILVTKVGGVAWTGLREWKS